MRMMNFNAQYGCSHCSVQQEHHSEGNEKKKLRYPAEPSMGKKGELRTAETVFWAAQYIIDSADVGERMDHYQGIKNVSPLFQVSN
jgi:hypothetical protein